MEKKLFTITIQFAIVTCLILITSGCKPKTEPIAQTQDIETPQGLEIIAIHEERTVPFNISQKKTFNQCESASPLKAEIQFSQTTNEEAQQELVLTANVGGEVGLSPVAKLNIGTAIQSHFTNKQSESQGHAEGISIEVPAHAQQEYTIVWQENRREGSVEYVENGELKTANYSYQIGIEFVSSKVVDLECSGLPQSSATPYPTYTPMPTYTPQPTSAPNEITVVMPEATLVKEEFNRPTTVFNVGEWWDENNVSIRVKNVELPTSSNLHVDVEITNNSNQNLIFQWSHSRNFKLFDNTGFTYSEWQMIESKNNNENIAPGETIQLKYYPYGFTTAWIGDRVFDASVKDLYFEISDLAGTSEATWIIPIK